jgi:hypothetical protein
MQAGSQRETEQEKPVLLRRRRQTPDQGRFSQEARPDPRITSSASPGSKVLLNCAAGKSSWTNG